MDSERIDGSIRPARGYVDVSAGDTRPRTARLIGRSAVPRRAARCFRCFPAWAEQRAGRRAAGHRVRVRRRLEEVRHHRVRRKPFTRQPASRWCIRTPTRSRSCAPCTRPRPCRSIASSVQGGECLQAQRLNMTMPLDWRVIDHSVLAERQLRHGERDRRLHALPCALLQQEDWPGEHIPKSWAILGRAEFPGRRAMRREGRGSPRRRCRPTAPRTASSIRSTSPASFRSLDRIKPHVKAWYYDNSQAQALIEQEEVDLIAVMDGRASEYDPQRQGAVRDRLERADQRRRRPGLDRAGRLPDPERRDEVPRLRRPRRYLAVFARLIYYAPQNPESLDCSSRHRQADAVLSGEREARAPDLFRMVGRPSAGDAAAVRALAAIVELEGEPMSAMRRCLIQRRLRSLELPGATDTTPM